MLESKAGTNTLAYYYDYLKITAVKSFSKLVLSVNTGVNRTNHFTI
jgi:hypothetical protein